MLPPPHGWQQGASSSFTGLANSSNSSSNGSSSSCPGACCHFYTYDVNGINACVIEGSSARPKR